MAAQNNWNGVPQTNAQNRAFLQGIGQQVAPFYGLAPRTEEERQAALGLLALNPGSSQTYKGVNHYGKGGKSKRKPKRRRSRRR